MSRSYRRPSRLGAYLSRLHPQVSFNPLEKCPLYGDDPDGSIITLFVINDHMSWPRSVNAHLSQQDAMEQRLQRMENDFEVRFLELAENLKTRASTIKGKTEPKEAQATLEENCGGDAPHGKGLADGKSPMVGGTAFEVK